MPICTRCRNSVTDKRMKRTHFSDQVENNSRVYIITIETRESDPAHSAKFSIQFDEYEHITIRIPHTRTNNKKYYICSFPFFFVIGTP